MRIFFLFYQEVVRLNKHNQSLPCSFYGLFLSSMFLGVLGCALRKFITHRCRLDLNLSTSPLNAEDDFLCATGRDMLALTVDRLLGRLCSEDDALVSEHAMLIK